MSVVFPNFGLIGEIDPCSENAIDLINENFKKLDFILAFGVTRVSSLSLTASDGDKELLSTNNVIYYWESGQWNPVDLNIGIVAWDITNENAIMWNGTEWFVLNENTTAVNLGTGFEVFKEKISDELNFRTIIAGDNITITETADSLEIESVLSNNSVTEQKIEDGAVTADKLADVVQETKFLPSDISSSDADISALNLENKMTIGDSYRLEFFVFGISSSSAAFQVNETGIPSLPDEEISLATFTNMRQPFTIEFIAQGTGLIFSFAETGTSTLFGDGTRNETYVKLTKLPYNLIEGTL